jgi:hypothetical protein
MIGYIKKFEKMSILSWVVMMACHIARHFGDGLDRNNREVMDRSLLMGDTLPLTLARVCP